MSFTIPMVWREGKDHITYCYFCMVNLKGINRKNKYHVQYPNVPDILIPHGRNLADGNMIPNIVT